MMITKILFTLTLFTAAAIVAASDASSSSSSSLDQICTSLAHNYTRNDDDNRAYDCHCQGSTEDFIAECTHHHPTCWYRAPDLTEEMYTVDFSFTERWLNGASVDYEECLYHSSTCNTVCVGLTQDLKDTAFINGVACQNVTYCNEGTEEEDNVYDCRNVVPGLIADMCTGEGVEGSAFEPWAITSVLQATSKFEPGSCAQDSVTPDGFEYDASKCRLIGTDGGSSSSSSSSTGTTSAAEGEEGETSDDSSEATLLAASVTGIMLSLTLVVGLLLA